jgi:hypothetical protein
MYKIKHDNNQRCIIAFKNIKKNTTLFCEEIKFIVDKKEDYWYEKLLFHEISNNFNEFLDLMPQMTDKFIIKDGVFLKNYSMITNKNKKETLDLYYNKIIRNAFNIEIDNKSYATILYKGRLFNHSCEPNVKFEIITVKNKMYMKFYVCRDIIQGEELFDNYFDVNLPYQKRQLISTIYYGFHCCCNKCKNKK